MARHAPLVALLVALAASGCPAPVSPPPAAATPAAPGSAAAPAACLVCQELGQLGGDAPPPDPGQDVLHRHTARFNLPAGSTGSCSFSFDEPWVRLRVTPEGDVDVSIDTRLEGRVWRRAASPSASDPAWSWLADALRREATGGGGPPRIAVACASDVPGPYVLRAFAVAREFLGPSAPGRWEPYFKRPPEPIPDPASLEAPGRPRIIIVMEEEDEADPAGTPGTGGAR